MGYSWSIRGIFTGYSYVSVMCRLCIGYVSVMYRNILGGWRGDSTTLLTTIVFNKFPERPMCCFGRIVVEKKLFVLLIKIYIPCPFVLFPNVWQKDLFRFLISPKGSNDFLCP